MAMPCLFVLIGFTYWNYGCTCNFIKATSFHLPGTNKRQAIVLNMVGLEKLVQNKHVSPKNKRSSKHEWREITGVYKCSCCSGARFCEKCLLSKYVVKQSCYLPSPFKASSLWLRGSAGSSSPGILLAKHPLVKTTQ